MCNWAMHLLLDLNTETIIIKNRKILLIVILNSIKLRQAASMRISFLIKFFNLSETDILIYLKLIFFNWNSCLMFCQSKDSY